MRRRTKLRLALLALGAVSYGLGVRRTRIHADVHPQYWARWENQDLDEPFLWVALGDSTSQSVGVDNPDDGWIATNARRLEDELGRPVRVVNLAISGGKVNAVVEHQLPRLAQLLEEHDVDLVTCAIGSNDVFKTGYDASRFAVQLDQVAEAMPRGSVLAEVPYFGRSWAGMGRFEKRALELNEIVRDTAKRHSHVLAALHEPTELAWPFQVWGNLAGDLFHPNERGYEVWSVVLGHAIDESLRRRAQRG